MNFDKDFAEFDRMCDIVARQCDEITQKYKKFYDEVSNSYLDADHSEEECMMREIEYRRCAATIEDYRSKCIDLIVKNEILKREILDYGKKK